MTVTGLSRTKYQLDSQRLSDGGEGEIYRVLCRGAKMVAKIYKPNVCSRELEKKLQYMMNRKPASSLLYYMDNTGETPQVAWPLDVIYDPNRQFRGFIMPELTINAELGKVYTYPSQSNVSMYQKILIARNISSVIAEVHNAGYVFGDFNPRNIGVDKNACTVSFLDTDSYHIVNRNKNIAFRCNVCGPGYAAPELLRQVSGSTYSDAPLDTFTKETDNFALAIHIFKLLMNGYSPFGGIPDRSSASTAAPGVGDAAVRRDSYCFKPGFKHLAAAILPLDAFPQEIGTLFTLAFINGKNNPAQRPTAIEWRYALDNYARNLVTCPHNDLHQYDRKNNKCPYCKADDDYKINRVTS